jgi:hypothetical protein
MFKIKVENNFPDAGSNYLQVTVEAPNLGVALDSSFRVGGRQKDSHTYVTSSSAEWSPAAYPTDLTPETIDVSFDFTDVSGALVNAITGLTPGTEYSIIITFTPLFGDNWETADIKTTSPSLSGSTDAMDMSVFGENLPGLELEKAAAKLVLGPKSLGGSLDGRIYADYNLSLERLDLLGTSGATSSINFTGSLPQIPKGTVVKAQDYAPLLDNFNIDVTPLINDGPTDLKFHYNDVIVSGFTITKADIDAGDTVSFAGDMVIDIPLKIATGEIDLKKLMDMEDDKDLLGRDDPAAFDDMRDFLDSLVSMTLTLDYTNTLFKLAPGEKLNAQVYTGTAFGETDKFNEVIEISSGTGSTSIVLTADEIEKYILDDLFKPQIKLVIPPSGAGLRRDGKFEIGMRFTLATDINYTYDLTKGK